MPGPPCAERLDACRAGTCRLCWLWRHDRRYRREWGGNSAGVTDPLRPAPGGPPPGPPRPAAGPGAELAALLHSLGLAACLTCQARARQMDAWGTAGCRARRAEIAGWLRAAAAGMSGAAQAWAALRAAASGLAWRLDPADVYGSLVDEACRRAEVKEAAAPAATFPRAD